MKKIVRSPQKLTKAFAVVGEGLTEVLYFNYIKTAIEHSYTLRPSAGYSSDYTSVFEKAAKILDESNYDLAFCIIDFDRIASDNKKLQEFLLTCKDLDSRIVPVPSSPCIEFWFLLHVWKTPLGRHFGTFAQLEPEIKKVWQNYDKSKDFLNTSFFRKLDSNRRPAIASAESIITRNKLSRKNCVNHSFTEVGRLISFLENCNKCEGNCMNCKEPEKFLFRNNDGKEAKGYRSRQAKKQAVKKAD